MIDIYIYKPTFSFLDDRHNKYYENIKLGSN